MNSNVRGAMLPVGREAPSVSASLSALRSIAWLAASRTRRSAHGRLRIPLVEEVQVVHADRAREAEPEIGVALQLLRGRRVEQVGDVDLAALQHRRRVVASGTLLKTRRFTEGILRQ